MSMPFTKNEIYDVWRPGTSPWTRWAKPVLFSFVDEPRLSTAPEAPQPRRWDIPLEQETAIVVDLPGSEGVWAGLALAQGKYRPVPVYNACPFPPYDPDPITGSILSESRLRAATAVDVASIVRAIRQTTGALRDCTLSDEAPPAFLIDRNRKGHGRPEYGWFDNRSFVSPSDFPSAEILRQHRIRHVTLVATDRKIDHDLTSVLVAWQAAGIQLRYQNPWLQWRPEPHQFRSPSLLRRVWNGLLLLLGYPARKNGAFGEWVRASSS